MLLPSKPILAIKGLAVSRENSAIQMRDAWSGQRTVKLTAVAETATGPCLTPEMSAGIMAATPSMGTRKIENFIVSCRMQYNAKDRCGAQAEPSSQDGSQKKAPGAFRELEI